MTARAAILTVYEHQVLRADDFPVTSDFTWLLEQDFAVFTPSRKHGQWCLSVRQYIGVVRLPSGTLLEILPKIAQPDSQAPLAMRNSPAVDNQHLQTTRAWVQRMLNTINRANSATLRPKHLSQLTPQLQNTSATTLPLSEWLLAEFMALLAQYKPLKHYNTQEQNSSSLQGKLLIKQQLQYNAQQPHRFYSEVTQLAQLTLSNRFIKQAWQLVTELVYGASLSHNLELKSAVIPVAADPAPALIQTLRAQAHHLQGQWQAIAGLTAQERHRLAESYQQAATEITKAPIAPSQKQVGQQLLALAYWLLSANTAAHSAGVGIHNAANTPFANSPDHLQLSLFINMHHAFEAWVSIVLAEQFHERDPNYQMQAQPQRTWLVDEAGVPSVTAVPDLYVSYQQQPSHIIDMKWKTIRSSRDISASDAYQLAAYAQAYQVRKVWLVYPTQGSTAIAPSKLTPYMTMNTSAANISANDLFAKGIADLEIWLVPFAVERGEVIIFNHNKYYDLF